MVQCWVCFNRVQLEICVVSYSLWMTVAAHLLFNCFTSACTGLHSFPLSLPQSPSHTHTHTDGEQHFLPLPPCPVQSFWLLNQSCSLCLVSSSQDHPCGPLQHTRSPVWFDKEGGEMGTEWRDGVRYKNVKRRRMLNEHHREEAVDGVEGRAWKAHCFNSHLCSCQWQSQFSIFSPHQFQRWIPGTRPQNQSQGLSSGSSPKKAWAKKKVGGLTWGWKDEDRKTVIFCLASLQSQSFGLRQKLMFSLLGWRREMGDLHWRKWVIESICVFNCYRDIRR